MLKGISLIYDVRGGLVLDENKVLVHVVAFEPIEGLSGVGGHDWFYKAEDADLWLRESLKCPWQRDSHRYFRFDAWVSSYESATEEVDFFIWNRGDLFGESKDADSGTDS